MQEFEKDRTSSRKSVKNEQMGSHGLFCEIFVYYDFIFDKKIYWYVLMKKTIRITSLSIWFYSLKCPKIKKNGVKKVYFVSKLAELPY